MKGTLLGYLLFAGLPLLAQQVPVGSADSIAVKEFFFAGLREKMYDNYDKAQENFSRVIKISPENHAAHFELAALYYKQNKLAEAERAVKKAVAVNSGNVWYWKLLAELYKRKGDMTSLIPVFDHLILLAPEEEGYYFDRSNALQLSGKSEEALKGYSLIEKKFGQSQALREARQRITSGKPVEASDEEIEAVLSQNPNDARSYLYVSGLLLEKGKLDEALSSLKKAKETEPGNYEVDLAMADVYQDQKNFKEADAALKSAFKNPGMSADEKSKIVSMLLKDAKHPMLLKQGMELAGLTAEIHPSDPKALVLYADVLYQQGQLQLAEVNYLKVLASSERGYQLWENLINTRIGLNKYTEAGKSAEEALSLYPSQARLYYLLAFIQHRSGDNKKAIANIKTAQELDADNKELQAMVLALQGEIAMDEGKYSAANSAFDQAVALAPDNFEIINNYAYYLALRNQSLNKAASLMERALAAVPQNASMADTYGLVLLKLGKYGEAKTWIERALRNSASGNPVYLEHYGDVLFLMGNETQGLAEWAKARAAGNDSEKLKKKIDEKKYIK